ncbi:hypothetical protein DSO57_1002694 [Entomophthora muscae]|uniref:Uncharacterized protein n=1 Tax=Entomophthora muscae TaxID=34485 RepID=A0ACC2UJL5_9FUNG|nr:hypothetical protein DSO57_1002694 [Entomophthora muscae]
MQFNAMIICSILTQQIASFEDYGIGQQITSFENHGIPQAPVNTCDPALNSPRERCKLTFKQTLHAKRNAARFPSFVLESGCDPKNPHAFTVQGNTVRTFLPQGLVSSLLSANIDMMRSVTNVKCF